MRLLSFIIHPMDLETTQIAKIQLGTGFSPGNEKSDERFRGFRRPREGNSPPDPRQRALFCPCGTLPPLIAGLCNPCYWKSGHSLRFYGGCREEVLERDGHRCRACGSERWVGVHHREARNHTSSLLIALCAACHAQVHGLLSIWKWIQLNFGGREQLLPQGDPLG